MADLTGKCIQCGQLLPTAPEQDPISRISELVAQLESCEREVRRLKIMNNRFEMALRGLGYTSDNSIFIQVTKIT